MPLLTSLGQTVWIWVMHSAKHRFFIRAHNKERYRQCDLNFRSMLYECKPRINAEAEAIHNGEIARNGIRWSNRTAHISGRLLF